MSESKSKEKKEKKEKTENKKIISYNWSENVFEVYKETGMMVVNINGSLYPPITFPKSVYWLSDNFKPNKYDIFIVTYPKCGTTWMQKICVEIMKIVLNKTSISTLNDNDNNDNNDNDDDDDKKYINIDCSNLYFDGKFSNIYYLESMINNDINYFESFLNSTNKLYIKNNNFLRFWKSHSLYSIFPTLNKEKNKYILIIRDPKDVIISYYEYLKLIGSPIFKCKFDKFFELFICGLIPGGNYWQWVNDWWYQYKNNINNILWIYYEDLKKDPMSEIIRIIKFLNFEDIICSTEEIKTIIKNSSFNKMKEMIKSGKDNYPLNFFRKGIIGDYKNVLNSKQIDILNMITNTKFHKTDLKYFFNLK